MGSGRMMKETYPVKIKPKRGTYYLINKQNYTSPETKVILLQILYKKPK